MMTEETIENQPTPTECELALQWIEDEREIVAHDTLRAALSNVASYLRQGLTSGQPGVTAEDIWSTLSVVADRVNEELRPIPAGGDVSRIYKVQRVMTFLQDKAERMRFEKFLFGIQRDVGLTDKQARELFRRTKTFLETKTDHELMENDILGVCIDLDVSRREAKKLLAEIGET